MDDLISRLSELRCQYNCFDENERNAYHTLSEAIKALSDVPDTNIVDTINRQAAIEDLQGYICSEPCISDDKSEWEGYIDGINLSIAVISQQPTIEAEPVRHGRWLDGNRGKHDGTLYWYRYCSECLYERHDDNEDKDTPYCPDCGAKMDGGEG